MRHAGAIRPAGAGQSSDGLQLCGRGGPYSGSSGTACRAARGPSRASNASYGSGLLDSGGGVASVPQPLDKRRVCLTHAKTCTAPAPRMHRLWAVAWVWLGCALAPALSSMLEHATKSAASLAASSRSSSSAGGQNGAPRKSELRVPYNVRARVACSTSRISLRWERCPHHTGPWCSE